MTAGKHLEGVGTGCSMAVKSAGLTHDDILRDIAQMCGTPVYVFDLDIFRDRFQYVKDIMGDEIKVNYCMKTNPFLAAESLTHADRIEVCSFGEFLICRDMNIPPEKLLISGVLKKREDMEIIMEYCRDDAIYTAESASQLHIINDIAAAYGYVARTYIRLAHAQFGMDEESILEALRNISQYGGIEFYGIHYFTGTQKHKLSRLAKEISKLDTLLMEIREETGLDVGHIEYGTGFGVPYFKGQEDTATSEEFLRGFRSLLANMQWQGEISIELGRSLAYDCGCYMTAVRDLKTSSERNYAIVDGGIHQINYDGQLRGMYVPQMHVLRMDSDGSDSPESSVCRESDKDVISYSINGSLCTVNDVLVGSYESRELHEGDIIVFERAGAYSMYEGMSLFLSHELPSVVFYSRQKGINEVRKRSESYIYNMPCC